ncbi:MAG: hypothetical protein HY928_09880 [Elusimicrobia bacterium]|nr:hypothetical protein [Elusimicrobiota bacterium]
MRALLLLGLILSQQAAGASESGCMAAYKAEYAEQWMATQENWKTYCAKGFDGPGALRQAQRDSMAWCMAKFSPFEREGKIPVGNTQAYCAQGAAGRERLSAAAGIVQKPPPPAVPPVVPVKAGGSRMGPFGKALEVAGTSWKPDACFSGLLYRYVKTSFIEFAEWERARASGRPPNVGSIELEAYTYYFHTDSDPLNAFRVSYGDKLELTFCYKVDRMDGPDFTDTPEVAGLDACLGPVDIDLPTAIGIAVKNGLVMDVPFTAYLAQLPPGLLQRMCQGRLRQDSPLICSARGEWDAAKLRRVSGKPIWVLSSFGRTAFVDALKGRFRYLGPGTIDLGASGSSKFAGECSHDRKDD